VKLLLLEPVVHGVFNVDEMQRVVRLWLGRFWVMFFAFVMMKSPRSMG
jgi:hypothetical protein